jgi:hypothetical protein
MPVRVRAATPTDLPAFLGLVDALAEYERLPGPDAEAVRRGRGRMEWAVLDWNQTARAFYDRMGARRLEEWPPYRPEGEPLRRVAEGLSASHA